MKNLKRGSSERLDIEERAARLCLEPPAELGPVERTLWIINVFSHQVAALAEDAELSLELAIRRELAGEPVTQARRSKRRSGFRPGGYRMAG